MPVTPQHLVLFKSEGIAKAMTIPFAPGGFEFEGKVYRPSRRSLLEFNHLIRGHILVGFEFPSPEDAGEEFLSSRFVLDSRNVVLSKPDGVYPVLEIYLGSREGAESDQGLALGVSMFVSVEQDYILVLPRVTWAEFELGFELVTDGGRSPTVTPAAR